MKSTIGASAAIAYIERSPCVIRIENCLAKTTITRQPAMPITENKRKETRKILSASRFLPCA